MKISLVVPLFNEEETLPVFYVSIRSAKQFNNNEVEIVFINDGSTDGSEALLNALVLRDPLVKHVCFTRNFGKEAALFAGLESATGDVVIPMDVDLQDPIEVIPELIAAWQQGAEIVLAKRVNRLSDNRLKRISAKWFYRLHNIISHPKIEENVGDFRLMSREVVKHILLLKERNLFMKGILGWVGGKTAIVEYSRASRIAGKSKFNGWTLWNLALEGITSFSTLPLRIWTYIGLVISLISFSYGMWMIIEKLIWDNPVRGYTSIMVSMLFLGGVQLVGIGILDEYIGKIYLEVKQRPRYIKRTQRKS